MTILSKVVAAMLWLLLLLLMASTGAAVIISNHVKTSCEEAVITIDGFPSGVSLAQAWTNQLQPTCRNTRFNITKSSSRVAAQRVCGVSLDHPPVDIGILARPFLPTEATTNDGVHYVCVNNKNRQKANQSTIIPPPRTTIQVEVAMDALVLVAARNGRAAYCIEQLYDNGLTLEQLRILYSSYTLAQIYNITTLSPTTTTTLSPTSSFAPSVVRPTEPSPVTNAPAIPIPTAPTAATHSPVPPPMTLLSPTNFPVAVPVSTPTRPAAAPFRRPTPRPTIPQPTLRTIHWGFTHRPTRAGLTSMEEDAAVQVCNEIPALIAGPPTSSEVYQSFVQNILPDVGESISPAYYRAKSTPQLVQYLQRNTNAIAFVLWSEYNSMYQTQLVALPLQDTTNESMLYVAPNATTLRLGIYPLGLPLYMEVRSDHSTTTLRRIRPLFQLAYSNAGDALVSQVGLVPLSKARQAQMVRRLGIVRLTPPPTLKPTRKVPVAPPKKSPNVFQPKGH